MDGGVDVRRIRGVADHYRPAIRCVDDDALVADGVTRSRNDSHAVGDLRVAVDQFKPRAREIEPLVRKVLFASRPLELRGLDVDSPRFEPRFSAPVVQMEGNS